MTDLLAQYRLLDLSHPLSPEIPTWSGRCGFRLEKRIDYDQGLRVHTLKCHAGIGTHMDAPSHFIPGAWDIEQIPLEQCMAPAVVLHLVEESGPDFKVEIEHINRYEQTFGPLPERALILAHTGWSRYWTQPPQYRNADAQGHLHFPGFSASCAEYLAQKKIVGIGIDTLSPDGSNEGFPVHHHILGAKKYILENLANLDQLPPKGAIVLCLPVPYAGGTEAPVRVVALLSK